MATAEPTLDCAKHPGQPAAERCDHCGAPFCGDCRVEDTAAEEVFCSEPCREKRTKARKSVLLEGFDQPIRTGWRLFARSSVAVWLYTAPLAIAIVIVTALLSDLMPGAESGQSTVAYGARVVVFLLALAFGIALTQVVLSRQYSGLVQGNPYVWTLRRFVPWVLTWIICLAAIFLGTLALVLPGIYVGLRLFWADEFALIHRKGPVQALKESWELTRGHAGSIFLFQFLAGLVASVLALAALFLAYLAPLMLYVWGFSEVLKEGSGILQNVAAAFLAEHSYFLRTLPPTFFWLLFFVGYGALHAPQIVYLYGMRAERARSLVGSTKVLDVT